MDTGVTDLRDHLQQCEHGHFLMCGFEDWCPGGREVTREALIEALRAAIVVHAPSAQTTRDVATAAVDAALLIQSG